jgi:hypothetical protein
MRPLLPLSILVAAQTVTAQKETGVGLGNDAQVYSIGAGYDSEGPVTVSLAGFFGDNDEDAPDSYGGSGGILIQVTEQPINVCPAFSLSYSRLEELEELEDLGIDLDLWTAAAGVAF